MHLYDFEGAPNPRRARIFIAEKGIEIPTTQVDIRGGEQFSESFRAVNPRCMVPVLETDDGERITECMAICAYLEELYPEPPLFGRSAVERAKATMWDHIVEIEGLLALAEALRNTGEFFENRALPGPEDTAQVPALVTRGKLRGQQFFDRVDRKLQETAFIAGNEFSVADITLLVTTDVAKWVDVDALGGRAALSDWYARVLSRPSAAA
jgi:glutathione S-transferase